MHYLQTAQELKLISSSFFFSLFFLSSDMTTFRACFYLCHVGYNKKYIYFRFQTNSLVLRLAFLIMFVSLVLRSGAPGSITYRRNPKMHLYLWEWFVCSDLLLRSLHRSLVLFSLGQIRVAFSGCIWVRNTQRHSELQPGTTSLSWDIWESGVLAGLLKIFVSRSPHVIRLKCLGSGPNFGLNT